MKKRSTGSNGHSVSSMSQFGDEGVFHPPPNLGAHHPSVQDFWNSRFPVVSKGGDRVKAKPRGHGNMANLPFAQFQASPNTKSSKNTRVRSSQSESDVKGGQGRSGSFIRPQEPQELPANTTEDDVVLDGVLRRLDPHWRRTLTYASHVAVFTFKDGEWTYDDIVGSLSLYERVVEPRVSYILLNRNSMTNYRGELSPNSEVQTKHPYIMLKDDSGIRIFWFYHGEECQRMSQGLLRVCQPFSSSLYNLPQEIKDPKKGSKGTGGSDILQMLAKGGNKDAPSSPGKVHCPTPIKAVSSNPAANSSISSPSLSMQTIEQLEKSKVNFRMTLPSRDDPAILTKVQKPPKNDHLGELGNDLSRILSLDQNPIGIVPLRELQEDPWEGFVNPFEVGDPEEVITSVEELDGKRLDEVETGVILALQEKYQPGDFVLVPRMHPGGIEPELTWIMSQQYLQRVQSQGRDSVASGASGGAQLPPDGALNRSQLLATFEYLLRNDPAFVDKLHSTYAEVIAKK